MFCNEYFLNQIRIKLSNNTIFKILSILIFRCFMTYLLIRLYLNVINRCGTFLRRKYLHLKKTDQSFIRCFFPSISFEVFKNHSFQFQQIQTKCQYFYHVSYPKTFVNVVDKLLRCNVQNVLNVISGQTTLT